VIVADASVLANAVGDDGAAGAAARAALRKTELSFPDLAAVEVVSVLRRRWLAGFLSDSRFEAAVVDLAALPADRYPITPLLWRAFELRSNVTPYDAVYVALAEALACTLVTGDQRLAGAPGIKCDVIVVNETTPLG